MLWLFDTAKLWRARSGLAIKMTTKMVKV